MQRKNLNIGEALVFLGWVGRNDQTLSEFINFIIMPEWATVSIGSGNCKSMYGANICRDYSAVCYSSIYGLDIV